jgi:hypothetical protein
MSEHKRRQNILATITAMSILGENVYPPMLPPMLAHPPTFREAVEHACREYDQELSGEINPQSYRIPIAGGRLRLRLREAFATYPISGGSKTEGATP